jgi:hypothetical protein
MVQIEGKTAIIFDREVRRQIAHLMAPGDAMIQNQFCHGNAKSDEKKTRNYVSTKKSTRDKMKTEPGVPSNV